MKPTFLLHSLRSYMSLSSFNNAHQPLFREIIGRKIVTMLSRLATNTLIQSYISQISRLEQQNVCVCVCCVCLERKSFWCRMITELNTFTYYQLSISWFQIVLREIDDSYVGVTTRRSPREISHDAEKWMLTVHNFIAFQLDKTPCLCPLWNDAHTTFVLCVPFVTMRFFFFLNRRHGKFVSLWMCHSNLEPTHKSSQL